MGCQNSVKGTRVQALKYLSGARVTMLTHVFSFAMIMQA
ncbi:hypothetical protein N826_11455 [Skermanella aerolata KACC 11604]|nr:hypothetical protein N826_11455 [Skermanella aerolata KACC 11604]